jgi:protein SCO1/2
MMATPGTPTRRSRRLASTVLAIVVLGSALFFAGSSATRAQSVPLGGMPPQTGVPASLMPVPLREVGFDQRLNERVPLDVTLRDERGRAVKLGDYFGRRPVVLTFVYYECPMLCTTVLNSLVAALITLSFDPGKDFEIVTVSFDPRETPALAAAKKATYLERYRRTGAEDGWHFLTGDEASITRLTGAVGFRYVYDKDLEQYAHPAGITVLTPDGRLSHYLYGIEYGPRDLRLALVDASAGRIGNAVDQVLSYCYQYNPATGRYGFVVMTLVRAAGVATVFSLLTFIVIMRRREIRAQRAALQTAAAAPRTQDPERG